MRNSSSTMRTRLRLSFLILISVISSNSRAAPSRDQRPRQRFVPGKSCVLHLVPPPRQNCHRPAVARDLAERKGIEAVAIGHAPCRPIRESRRQRAVHALCPRFQMIRAGRRLGSFGAHLHTARHAKRIDHHNGECGPGPFGLTLTPAPRLDREQLAGPKIEDGDIFQAPPLRRGAGIVVKQSDAAQRSLQDPPIQEIQFPAPYISRTRRSFGCSELVAA